MHHRAGAFAETCYIYGPAVAGAFQQQAKPCVFSLGLGLGYNEILTAVCAARTGKAHDFLLQSFEIDDNLIEFFFEFLGFSGSIGGKNSQTTELGQVYLDICQRFEISVSEVSEILGTAREQGRWMVESEFYSADQIRSSPHVFLWDAFSQKSSPSLWQEEFLKQSLGKSAPEGAWFATYACNAALKNALKQSDWTLKIRPGYQGKRECTWGFSGSFNSFEPSAYPCW